MMTMQQLEMNESEVNEIEGQAREKLERYTKCERMPRMVSESGRPSER